MNNNFNFPKRYFGVELESHPSLDAEDIVKIINDNCKRRVHVTGWKQTHNNSYWHLKTDSTCGGGEKNGWEIASFKASGEKDLKHIAKIASALGSSGLVCGDDCGLHVHVDISDFSPSQAGVLLAIWSKIEKIMLESVPRHRRYNRHCRPVSNKIIPKKYLYDPLSFWDTFKPTNFSTHNNREKRVSLNFVNYASSFVDNPKKPIRRTVEFRFPEGTFVEEDINNWIYLFLNFIETSSKKQMPENIFSVKTVNEFLNLVGLCGEDLFSFNVKNWFFDRISKNGNSKKWKKAFEKQILNTK